MPVLIRTARIEEHKIICAIAKQSKYTRDFSNMIFSGPDCYAAERIKVAIWKGDIIGFYCIRHRKRNPATVLYFLAVAESGRLKGTGKRLMNFLERECPSGLVELKVMKDNPAVGFYDKLGYSKVEEAFDGKGWKMQKSTRIATSAF